MDPQQKDKPFSILSSLIAMISMSIFVLFINFRIFIIGDSDIIPFFQNILTVTSHVHFKPLVWLFDLVLFIGIASTALIIFGGPIVSLTFGILGYIKKKQGELVYTGMIISSIHLALILALFVTSH